MLRISHIQIRLDKRECSDPQPLLYCCVLPPFCMGNAQTYDIKFVNNRLSNVYGAAFGVWGGYNILMAYNTAYRVGARSHTLEVIFGTRSCNNYDNPEKCAAYVAQAGGGDCPVRRMSRSRAAGALWCACTQLACRVHPHVHAHSPLDCALTLICAGRLGPQQAGR